MSKQTTKNIIIPYYHLFILKKLFKTENETFYSLPVRALFYLQLP